MRDLVVGGNWKLKVNSIVQTKMALKGIIAVDENISKTTDLEGVEIFLALPYTSLFLGNELLEGTAIKLAAQNVHYDTSGPYTGEISVESLKEFNVQYVLVGHSERRIIFDEQDENLNKKVHLVLKHNITPVFCIGETAADREAGRYKEVLYDQMRSGLNGVSASQMRRIILAYEPVWAINNPLLNPDAEIKAATPQEAEEIHLIIRAWLRETYDDQIAQDIQILYGGSMKPGNAQELLSLEQIDGGLIGSASISADSLGPIIKIARNLQSGS